MICGFTVVAMDDMKIWIRAVCASCQIEGSLLREERKMITTEVLRILGGCLQDSRMYE